MKGSKEQYLELCEEWININPITGFNSFEPSNGHRYKTSEKKKNTISKNELKVWKS